MTRVRLLWQIALPLVVLVIVSLGALTWGASGMVHDFHLDRTREDLFARAALVEHALAEALPAARRHEIDPVAKRLGSLAGMRVTVIAPDGTVLGESDRDPVLLDNHAGRPEVAEALQHGQGTAIRFSDTVEVPMMYAARAVRPAGAVLGVVRIGLPLASLEGAVSTLQMRAAIAALVLATAATALGLWIARRITRPLEDLEVMAESCMAGEVPARAPAAGSSEIARVAEAVHRLAHELDARIRSLVAERNEQQAVLGSMVEAVLAVDTRERVMALNAAGADVFGVDPESAVGRSIQEVARNSDLHRFVAEALAADGPIERELAVHAEAPRYLQAHGAPVRDRDGVRIGAVVVLNDITRMRLLETVRRDFVANVSHELKTPVTSIKGFLETLLGGAIDDVDNRRRFLEIASRQADRLGAIIDDLLLLSRVEQESDQQTLERPVTSLATVVSEAVDVCALDAERKKIELRVQCGDGVQARVNGALVEQAVVNLIGNAIKYSEEGSTVDVEARRDGADAVIEVRDRGVGIEAEHLPRLFERFYRVDKARSRALGGTGLGLAIVKHIVQAQGGTVTVASRPGSGSTFALRFAAA
ncbi:MAG TPA: ATP-binding protein [Candidatus Limnocylindrales bacterium]|nr:ATP-binding protein [Candidatus Limnocylindrales bacterium]